VRKAGRMRKVPAGMRRWNAETASPRAAQAKNIRGK
jgi:hypothetical protein